MPQSGYPATLKLVHTREIDKNIVKKIHKTVKETGRSKKNKLSHQQDYKIPLSNSFETLPIEECHDTPEPADEDNSVLFSFDDATNKRRLKKQSTKYHKQPEAYITNNQSEEHLQQKKERTVRGKRTYAEVTKFEKENCVIGDSHLNRIRRNIFQKLVNRAETCFNVFEALHLRD